MTFALAYDFYFSISLLLFFCAIIMCKKNKRIPHTLIRLLQDAENKGRSQQLKKSICIFILCLPAPVFRIYIMGPTWNLAINLPLWIPNWSCVSWNIKVGKFPKVVIVDFNLFCYIWATSEIYSYLLYLNTVEYKWDIFQTDLVRLSWSLYLTIQLRNK